MKNSVFKILLLLFVSIVFSTFSSLANAALYDDNFCPQYPAYVPVKMNVIYGDVEYLNDLKNASFAKYLKKELEIRTKLKQNVRGLTVAQSFLDLQGKANVAQKGNRFCVSLSAVDLTFGFKRIIVLIDKKYRPGSCEYNAVKEHEDTHVFLNKDVLRYYYIRIKKKAEEAAMKTLPRIEYTKEKAEEALVKMVQEVEKAIMPEVKEFEKLKDSRNEEIDTESSYLSVTDRCKNW